jgi:uncharacterized protein
MKALAGDAPSAARDPFRMTDIRIHREAGAAGGRYVAEVDAILSEMTYTLRSEEGGRGKAAIRVMSIDHTGVPKALSGKGVGLALVRRAVEDARAEGFRIEPRCSFVRVMMERHRDLADVRVG